MGLKKLFITLVLSLVLLPVIPALADSTTVDDISKELMCQCGCGLVLVNCTCELPNGAAEMKALIEQRLALGESQKEIIQYFVDQYGEQVLSSPPKSGFNLMVWLLPIVGLLFGGGMVYFVLKRGLGRGRQPPASTMAETSLPWEALPYLGPVEFTLIPLSEYRYRNLPRHAPCSGAPLLR